MMVFSVRSRNDECVNEMSASSVVGGGFFCFCFFTWRIAERDDTHVLSRELD